MRRAGWILLIAAILANLLVVVALLGRCSYAPLPSRGQLANSERNPLEGAYDVLGRVIDAKEAGELLATEQGAAELTPEMGAVPLTSRLVEDGRKVFYRETFGNERFLTDVLGLLDGGFDAPSVLRALVGLGGRGTGDLRVRLGRDVRVGERLFRAGTMVSTGLDVPRGGWLPLGIRVFYDRGRLLVGVTCAACHATVEPDSGLVVEGAPNTNLNVGLLLAFASNSAAYYLHTGVSSFEPFLGEDSLAVRSSEGIYTQIPEPEPFEAAVSGMLAQWPPGFVDTTGDGVSNPVSIPDTFTAEDHPFGWTGFADVGPFRGLSAMSNIHVSCSDKTALAASMPYLGPLDSEVYLAVLLLRAANRELRFDPYGEQRPSQVLDAVMPTPSAPGLNRSAVLPSFPRPDYFTLDGLIPAREGEPVGYAVNALSAFQNSLKSAPRYALNSEGVRRGQAIFESAGCGACHAGPGWSDQRVLSVEHIETEPSRAKALAETVDIVVSPETFAPDTPFPPPADATLVPIPVSSEQRERLRLSWAHGTAGGYKVKGLVGLEWSAPYLHDGGVALGPAEGQWGIPGTWGRGVAPDARSSLRALIDRALRARVVAANAGSSVLAALHITGQGHPYWVDLESGFAPGDQEALLDYLLSLREIVTRPSTQGSPR